MAETALAAYYSSDLQEESPHLSLVAATHGEIIKPSSTPEDELAQRRNRYAGKVSVENCAKLDAITEIAEGVDGQMRAVIELTTDGKDLYGPDGRSLIQTADKGIESAIKDAEANPNLKFEIPRRKQERRELDIVIKAFSTGSANTIDVTSDYPHALNDSKKDIGGYNSRRQQAMNRIWMKTSDGKILLISQTLDRSNRRALEAMHKDLNHNVIEGELLYQPHLMTLTDEQQKNLPNRTTTTYDQNLEAQYNEKFYAGRRPIDYRNTFEFAQKQHDLVGQYVEAVQSGNLNDSFMYDLLATANARFEKYQLRRVTPSSTSVLSAAGIETAFNRTSYSRAEVAWEMQNEGRSARRQGKTFSACGSSYSSTGESDSVEMTLESAGFGKSSEKSWHGGKKFKNTKCESCKQVKHEVGACKICEECVKNPKKQSHSGTKTTKKATALFNNPAPPNNYIKALKSKSKNSTSKAKISYTAEDNSTKYA